MKRAIAAACNSVGITPHDYARAVDAAPELAMLERETLREALAGTTDPGPYAEISRESPSGRPGELEKNRSHPVLGDGGVEPNVAARGSHRSRP